MASGWLILVGIAISIVVGCLLWSSVSHNCFKCFSCCSKCFCCELQGEDLDEDFEKGKDEEEAITPDTQPAPARDLEAARFSGSGRSFSKRSMEASGSAKCFSTRSMDTSGYGKSLSSRSMEALEENPYKDEKFSGKYRAPGQRAPRS